MSCSGSRGNRNSQIAQGGNVRNPKYPSSPTTPIEAKHQPVVQFGDLCSPLEVMGEDDMIDIGALFIILAESVLSVFINTIFQYIEIQTIK